MAFDNLAVQMANVSHKVRLDEERSYNQKLAKVTKDRDKYKLKYTQFSQALDKANLELRQLRKKNPSSTTNGINRNTITVTPGSRMTQVMSQQQQQDMIFDKQQEPIEEEQNNDDYLNTSIADEEGFEKVDDYGSEDETPVQPVAKPITPQPKAAQK